MPDVAPGVVKALSGTPVILGLILINAMFIAAVFYPIHQQAQRKDELITLITTECIKRH